MSDLIITEKYLKDNSLVNENVDMRVITPIIILVQDMYVKHILGDALFDQIQSQIDASTPGTNDAVSAANVTLLDKYLLPTMIWYIMSEATPAMKYRYMNKGVQTKNSENSATIDLQEVAYLFEKWKKNAESYAERLTKFLIANVTTYPLLLQNVNYDSILPNNTNYTCGLYLEGGSGFIHRFRGENDPYRTYTNGTSDIKNK